MDHLVQIILLLAVAVAIMIVFQRLHVPTSLGYLLVGLILGPHTAGPTVYVAEFKVLAEFGVVFLLFSIGLAYSLPQLHAMGEVGEAATEDAPALEFRDRSLDLLATLAPEAPADANARDAALAAAHQAYQALKAHWLEAGARGNIPVTEMDAYLRAASALRRALEQATKAAHRLNETT